ncbi:unnamed protein product [Somion occarium]|uniref:Wax synthase domain-containing protein n=1 Tax=Somion occarium TaxID=3059160 RepID=A0ABP1DTQ7_9APHY
MARVSFRTELLLTLERAFRELVPEPPKRYPLTWKTAPYAYAYLLPLLFMAYLSQRRDTQIIRLLLLPTCLVMAIRGTYAYDWFEPDYYFFTWLRGLTGLAAAGLSVDFAFSQTARLKVGETSLPAINEPESLDDSEDVKKRRQNGIFPAWLSDAVEALSTMRGIGWNFGKSTYIPRERRPLERQAFLRETARLFIKKFILADIFESLIKSITGIGSTSGGSMFFSNYPVFKRYAVSTGIQFLAGITLTNGVECLNLLLTIIGVGLLGQSPTEWPLILDQPFDSESLHDFWTQRWHQTLRRIFVVLGGIPGEYLYGRTGFIFGAFLASGLFHEGGTYLMGRGVDYRVVLFFVLQSLGVWMEEFYRYVTGKRVGGIPGTLWTYFWIIGLGQMCSTWLFMKAYCMQVLTVLLS